MSFGILLHTFLGDALEGDGLVESEILQHQGTFGQSSCLEPGS